MQMRPLLASDEALLFAWRCDEEVVRASVDQKCPTVEEHAAWMTARLFEAHWKTLIADTDGPIGTCTFRVNPDATVNLSYMVAPGRRGHGLGVELVELALEHIGPCLVILRIRAENAASLAVARVTGFDVQPSEIPGWIVCQKAAL